MQLQRTNDMSVKQSLQILTENSLSVDLISSKVPYTNAQVRLCDSSDLNLILRRLVILDSILDIRNASTYREFTEAEKHKYFMQPKSLSFDTYGYIDMWYLILAVNGYESVYEFKDFDTLWMPVESVVSKIVMEAEYKKKKEEAL